jgi:hypothetical protein
MTPTVALLPLAVLHSLFTYLTGHQARHLAFIDARRASLSPLPTIILALYQWLFFPWLFLVWYSYKTVWWQATAGCRPGCGWN